MNKKVLLTATIQGHIWQFYMPLVKALKKHGYEVHIAARNNKSSNYNFSDFGVDEVFDIPFSRSPKSVDNIKAYKILKKLIRDNKYDIIHCNTPMGGVVTRLAAGNARKNGTKVIYTAHGFHFYKGAPIINWLFYCPIEWMLAFRTDVLITINNEDYRLAKKHMHAKSVKYVPGVGIDMKKFSPLNAEERRTKRAELGISDDEIMLLSVGELSVRKNQQLIIRALKRLNNSKIKYFIVGQGSKLNEYEELAAKFGIENRVILLGYRNDIKELCAAADLFVFPSYQEGLPVALMEAMAVCIPIICSSIRGNTDLIKDKDYIFDPNDIEEAAKTINKAINSDNSTIVENNYKILQKYDINNVIDLLLGIYDET